MITRSHRFHGYNSLDAVYRHGKTGRGPHLMLRYMANPKRSSYRAAVVVSKKVHKSAVVRNRIRRRIFEIVRHNQELIHGPFDLVFTVFDEEVAAMPATELERLVVKQLRSLTA